MEAYNASGKVVRRIKEDGIRIGYFVGQGQGFSGIRIVGTGLDVFHQFNGPFGPDSPVTKQSTRDTFGYKVSLMLDTILTQKIYNDVVIVAGVESDFACAAGGGDGAENLEGLVAIEGCDFDRHDVVNFNEAAPESVGQNASSHGGLVHFLPWHASPSVPTTPGTSSSST